MNKNDNYNDMPIPGVIHADSSTKGWNGLHASILGVVPSNDESPEVPEGSGLILGYRLDGAIKSRYKIGDNAWKTTICEKDRFMVIPGSQKTLWRWRSISGEEAPLDLMVLNIQQDLIDDVVTESSLCEKSHIEFRSLTDLADPQVSAMINRVQNELVCDDAYTSLSIDALKQQILVHLLRNYSVFECKIKDTKSSLTKVQLKIVHDYICENMHCPVALKELSNLLSISEYHFSRLYKNATGSSPYQYLVSYRLSEARRLLTKPTLNVKEIAYRVGYKDVNHFHKAFKNRYGLTPVKYRKSKN